MGSEVVKVRGQVPRDPEAVWSVVRDFCGAWHPWVTSIREERDPQGACLRAFTVSGEATVYRERQTYLSDSDRVLGYTHLEGIRDCEAYDARIAVAPAEAGGSVVTWTATVHAPGSRLAEICEGTKAVFDAGIAALATASERETPVAEVASPSPVETIVFNDLPRLALSVTPDLGNERLCLFLHGIGGGRNNWHSQLQAVGRTMRAAAMDLRGYGDSALGAGQSSVDDYCADILRVANRLGARRLVLVGLSYGSWIATSFAMRHPGMLAGLVLSGGCTGMSEAGPEEREAFRTAREVPLDAGQVPADFAPAVVKVLAGPDASPEVLKTLFNSMAAIPAVTYLDALRCFTNPAERFDFARLAMPVLMMTGAHDRLASPAEIRAVAGRIGVASPRPDVRFEVIPGAGHVCNLERPQVYNRHLLAFLQRLP
ncbi:MAG: alpha/beta fold hydrolase [Tabrizicola sp.]|jgi:pimeloyl-ACP methyl ester carboxylesterase|nr:alpha/beta fold hydrolase [Tabrizicola sp.]